MSRGKGVTEREEKGKEERESKGRAILQNENPDYGPAD